MKLTLIASSLALALAAVSPALATPLPVPAPGATVPTTVTPSATSFGGTLVAFTGNQPAVAPTFIGLYTENVYANTTGSNPFCSGCLDFVIQVANQSPAGSGQIIERVTTSSFDGYLVDVGYTFNPNPNMIQPYDATRSLNGGVIGFDFILNPGQLTDGLVIHTNALRFTTGFLSVQDGTTANGALAYVPTGAAFTPVPEPSSLLLLGTGLIGAAGAARRKFVSFRK